MKRVLTYGLLAVVVLVLFLAGAALIVPRFLDMQRYTSTIENAISTHTGLTAHLNGDITLSLFPWIVVTFEELQLDSPTGTGRQPLLQVRSFEARLKTIPLLSKHIEISRFIIDGPQLFLEKTENNTWNWQNLTERQTPSSPSTPAPATDQQGDGTVVADPPAAAAGAFQLNSLQVAEFSIRNGSIRLVELATETAHVLAAINLHLNDVSLDRPIAIELEAQLDKQPLHLTGSIGPLGAQPGAAPLSIDLICTTFDTVTSRIKGTVSELTSDPSYQFDVTIDPFDLRQLVARIKPDVSLETTDRHALEHISLSGNLRGTARQMEITGGTIVIDDTTVSLERFQAGFAGPRLDLAVAIDAIDVDRYLPPAAADQPDPAGDEAAPPERQPENSAAQPRSDTQVRQSAGAPAGAAASPSAGTGGGERPPEHSSGNYESVRPLVLTATVKLGQLHVHGATATAIDLDLSGEKALFMLNSLALDLYEGQLTATGSIDLGRNPPASSFKTAVETVQVGPLLRDFADKDLLEGRLTADFDLAATGDRAPAIVSSLVGNGSLHFNDGALIGLDLAQMARTITSGFSLDEQQGERPRTDFSELNLPFSVADGLVTIPEATLKSPFLRAGGSGTVNLVAKTLDLRLRPELVATIKGQGDEEQRAGLAVPVLVRGTFSEPAFLPDLEALAREQLLNRQDVQDILEDGSITPERREQLSKEVEKAKGLLKGLFGK